MKNLLSLSLTLALAAVLPLAANAEQLELEAGTPIQFKLKQTVSEETSKNGDVVLYEVTKDIWDEGKKQVVIKKGSEAKGVYNVIEKCGLAGCKKMLGLTVEQAIAADGTLIPIDMNMPQPKPQKQNILTDNIVTKTAAKTVDLAADTTTSALDIALKPLTVLTGTNNKVLQGTTVKAYVGKDVEFNSEASARVDIDHSHEHDHGHHQHTK